MFAFVPAHLSGCTPVWVHPCKNVHMHAKVLPGARHMYVLVSAAAVLRVAVDDADDDDDGEGHEDGDESDDHLVGALPRGHVAEEDGPRVVLLLLRGNNE